MGLVAGQRISVVCGAGRWAMCRGGVWGRLPWASRRGWSLSVVAGLTTARRDGVGRRRVL
ncbi:hypothetical protein [Chloroflexus sp.]|uniref:hypothetical protein n=1 Tax=Chloroflexus sp. TaxID=1904827 RepID=UPI003C7750F3